MSNYDILVYPDLRLKQESRSVEFFTAEFREFVAALETTMLASPGCVGIAAPQIGSPVRVAIVDVSAKPKLLNHGRLILVNPEITHWEGHVMGREGCLSVPDYTGNVFRAEKIALDYFDAEGAKHHLATEGFEARAIQHELDHLDGVLFIDRVVSRRSDLFRRKNYQVKPNNGV
jgi:peptide deformylase